MYLSYKKFMGKTIIYFGNNNPFKHKRGVENVIEFQAKAYEFKKKYYLFFDFEKKIKIFRWGNIVCIGIPYDNKRFVVLNKILNSVYRKNKECFIHSHNPLMSFFSLKKIDIMTVHDGLYYQNKEKKHKLSKLFYLIEKLIYLKTKKIHFISDFSRKMSLFKGNNYIKIYNTSFLEFKNNSYPNKVVIEKLKKIKLFSVRSIEERARIDLLIDLAEKRKDLEINIAGKGPFLDFYRQKIIRKKLKNIKLLGFVEDNEIIKFYKECDIVIVTAEHGEGFGLPIIEGYLFNKPVIASNRCAIPEIIIANEFLFENRVDSIEEALYFTLTKGNGYDYKEFYNLNYSKSKILKEFKLNYIELVGEKNVF